MEAKAIIAVAVVLVIIAGAAAYLVGGMGTTQTTTTTTTTTTGPVRTQPVEKELKIGVVADKLVTDPAVANNIPSFYLISLTADGLVKIDPATGKLEPGLAVSWKTPDNGATWYFTLRQGVSFPDGTPLTADAVVNSLLRLTVLQSLYSWMGQAFLQGVEKVNDTVVKIKLTMPIADFPKYLASPYFAIVHPSYPLTKANPESTIIGIGPYLVKDLAADHVVLEWNRNYYGGAPVYERIVIYYYPDSASLRAAMESGQVDVAWWGLSSDDLATLERKGFQVYTSDPLIVKVLLLNEKPTKSPLADVELRKAIAYSLSGEDITGVLPGPLDSPAYSVVPSPLLGYKPVFEDITGNLAKAKEILRGKGYSEEKPLVLKMITSPALYGGVDKVLAGIVKAQIERTGMTLVDVVEYEPGDFIKALRSGDWDLALVTLPPLIPDPLFYVTSTLYSRSIYARAMGFSDPQVDSTLANAYATVDYTIRETTITTIQEAILAKQVPLVPIVELKLGVAAKQGVEVKLAENLFPAVTG